MLSGDFILYVSQSNVNFVGKLKVFDREIVTWQSVFLSGSPDMALGLIPFLIRPVNIGLTITGSDISSPVASELWVGFCEVFTESN